ncbi:hypothetical protein ElyMa_001273200 [Elysia marginata]|uniref:Uncharacterized protein n=1 Tax=Elysia marginata TaxID=1093978 RepID=A0AAV4IDW6_9GAST|nr:hypothetical protein ElyMa_001273200 [Elysia marginata]
MDRFNWQQQNTAGRGDHQSSGGFHSYRNISPAIHSWNNTAGQLWNETTGQSRSGPIRMRRPHDHSAYNNQGTQITSRNFSSRQGQYHHSSHLDTSYQGANSDKSYQYQNKNIDLHAIVHPSHHIPYHRHLGQSSEDFTEEYRPDSVNQVTSSSQRFHRNTNNNCPKAGYNAHCNFSGQERFHPYKPARAQRDSSESDVLSYHHNTQSSKDFQQPRPPQYRGSHPVQDYHNSQATPASTSHASYSRFGSQEPEIENYDDDNDDNENGGDDDDDDDDDDHDDSDSDDNAQVQEEKAKALSKKGKKSFKKKAKEKAEVVKVEPMLSFDDYVSLWENERNWRMKKLRLMACKASMSPEPRSIAKISNSRDADCNMRVAHRYDKLLAKKLGVPVVAHLLMDGILAATGWSSTKVEAKRSAFDEALRALYMPYLCIYTAPDEHRELHACMVPFSEAHEEQILKPKLPMAPKVIEHTKYRQLEPKPKSKAGRRFRRKNKK